MLADKTTHTVGPGATISRRSDQEVGLKVGSTTAGPRLPRQDPRANVVMKLAKALKVKVAELVG
ncbi:hypothetical protein MYX04_11260 [Nitrospiraceae bacterium AH_259_D15_M11_P09]|nr:hypothetical protein [Nitrospiraceae bacterium AH_259_D15_M11_P09]